MPDDDGFPVAPLDDEPKVGPSGKSPEQVKAERSERMRKMNAARAKAKGGSKPEPKTASPASSDVPADLNAVRVSVAEGLAKSGAMIMPALPLPGGYLIANADQAANVAARLAARHPTWLAGMSKASDYADYIMAGSLVLGFGVSVAVQIGRVPVDHPMAVNLGVTAVYDDMIESGQMVEAEPEGAHVADATSPDERAVPLPDILEGRSAAS